MYAYINLEYSERVKHFILIVEGTRKGCHIYSKLKLFRGLEKDTTIVSYLEFWLSLAKLMDTRFVESL